MRRSVTLAGLLLATVLGCSAPVDAGDMVRAAPDKALRARLAQLGVRPLNPGAKPPAAKVALGQWLFFDKVLGGNRDIACATCHHPQCFTCDGLCLSIGTKGVGLGPYRVKDPSRPFVARNATDLFDRGSPDWRTMFWDGRVWGSPATGFHTPAGSQLPAGLDSVLAAQAMFPVTGRDEMRGVAGDPGNELAPLADTDFQGIWQALAARLMAIPAYRTRFAAVYPTVPAGQHDFRHAANAIAAFEAAAYTSTDSPWDHYLTGNNAALTAQAKQGAVLFYGKAGCYQCHVGSLLTDQQYHNLAVPQFGPGKAPAQPLDIGRMDVTGNAADRFAFRTPPLRNVAVTGPWMHNGADTDLRLAIVAHLDPYDALFSYDPSQLPAALQPTLIRDPATLNLLFQGLDVALRWPPLLSTGEVDELVAFLDALTSPSLGRLEQTIPAAVPSGLPIDRLP